MELAVNVQSLRSIIIERAKTSTEIVKYAVIDFPIFLYEDSSPEPLRWLNYYPFSVAIGIAAFELCKWLLFPFYIFGPQAFEFARQALSLPASIFMYISASYVLAPRSKVLFGRTSSILSLVLVSLMLMKEYDSQSYRFVLLKMGDDVNLLGCILSFFAMLWTPIKKEKPLRKAREASEVI